MGFNKRFITEKSIRDVYTDKGYKGVKDYITKPDAIITKDELSEKVVRLLTENDSEQRLKILLGYGTNDERSE